MKEQYMNSTLQESHEVPTTTRRKKLTTIVFDTDFYMKTATRMLMKREGPEAILVYQIAICWAAYEQPGAVIRKSALPMLEWHLEDLGLNTSVKNIDGTKLSMLEPLFKAFTEVGFFRFDDEQDAWVSDRLLKELDHLNTKQANYKSGRSKRESSRIGEDPKQTSTNQNDAARIALHPQLDPTKPKIGDIRYNSDFSRIENNPQIDSRLCEVRKEQEQEQEQDKEKELDQEQEREQEPPDPPAEPEKPKLRLHVPEKPKPILEFEHPLAELASSALISSEDPTLATDPVYVATQRRPMRKYPEIYLTLPELCDVFEQAEKAGLPRSEMGMLFKPIAAECADRIRKGQSLVNFKTYIWLTGYALDNALTKYKKSLDVKRAESFAKAGGAK